MLQLLIPLFSEVCPKEASKLVALNTNVMHSVRMLAQEGYSSHLVDCYCCFSTQAFQNGYVFIKMDIRIYLNGD